jgi:hypothetical protein
MFLDVIALSSRGLHWASEVLTIRTRRESRGFWRGRCQVELGELVVRFGVLSVGLAQR